MVLKIFSQRESKRSRAFNLFEYTREGADALARNTALTGSPIPQPWRLLLVVR
ncbi:hypothetical protein GZOEXZXM_CDS0208 [Salmonella phage SeKF_64]|uniref:Uncharacterized protein n=2 Tax=Caudoviricetes TaxID=2731619 RepID=A0AB39C1A8_9CAUD|nr:hypothetical protein SeF6a_228 [Salmonella phage SeF6a]